MLKFWLWDTPASNEQHSLANLFLRIFVGFAMLTHGFVKIANFSTYAAVFPDPIGLGSETSLALAIFAEVVCSFLIILGLLTRPAALVLTFNMMVAAFVAHAGDPFSTKELALMYLAIYIVITVMGGGIYSLDHILFTSKRNAVTHQCTNISGFERVLRMGLGFVCWFFIFTGIVGPIGSIALLIISIPLFVTSFWGFCGIYRLLGKKTCTKD